MNKYMANIDWDVIKIEAAVLWDELGARIK
jgi:hypothetical protein